MAVERFEPLSTLNDAEKAFDVPIWKLRRAAKAGAFPTYKIGNGRTLVRLSEIVAAINASRTEG